MGDRDEIRTTVEDDVAIEAAVLRQLLALPPGHLTFEELVREVSAEPDDFGQRDAIERAVHDLGVAGLVHRSGALVLPSRAARRFDELLG